MTTQSETSTAVATPLAPVAIENLAVEQVTDVIASDQLGLIPTHWPVADLDEYHRDRTCESNSTLNTFAKNRYQFYLQRERGIAVDDGDKSYYKLGRILHPAAQELTGHEPRGSYRKQVAIVPEKNSKGNKFIRDPRSAEWQEFQAKHTGKVILTTKENQALEGMVAGILENKQAVEFLSKPCLVEHAIRFREQHTGIGLKVCFDLLSPEPSDACVYDIKSTSSDPWEFANTSWYYGYYRQAALYSYARDLYIFGEDHLKLGLDPSYPAYWESSPAHYHIVVGSQPPHECLVYRTPPAELALGWRHVQEILRTIKTCRTLSADGDLSAWHRQGHGKVIDMTFSAEKFNVDLGL